MSFFNLDNELGVELKSQVFDPFLVDIGFDIAFENRDEQYRASALIRAYEVYDEVEEKYMRVNKKGQFEYCSEPYINTQSTYLYSILNGFGDAGKYIGLMSLVRY